MLLFNITMAAQLGSRTCHVVSGRLTQLLRSRAGATEVQVRWLGVPGWHVGLCAVELLREASAMLCKPDMSTHPLPPARRCLLPAERSR